MKANNLVYWFVIETTLIVVGIVLTLLWFGWKLLLILYLWSCYDAVSEHTRKKLKEFRGEI
jgi:hypothetical protein